MRGRCTSWLPTLDCLTGSVCRVLSKEHMLLADVRQYSCWYIAALTPGTMGRQWAKHADMRVHRLRAASRAAVKH